MNFFANIEKHNLNFIQKEKETRITESILKNKNENGEIEVPILMFTLKLEKAKPIGYGNRCIDQQSKMYSQ